MSEWKSKGLFDESIKARTTSDNSLAPKLNYTGNKARVKLVGSCLKQDKMTYIHGKIVNIYICSEIHLCNYRYSDHPILGNCSFGALRLVKNADFLK